MRRVPLLPTCLCTVVNKLLNIFLIFLCLNTYVHVFASVSSMRVYAKFHQNSSLRRRNICVISIISEQHTYISCQVISTSDDTKHRPSFVSVILVYKRTSNPYETVLTPITATLGASMIQYCFKK